MRASDEGETLLRGDSDRRDIQGEDVRRLRESEARYRFLAENSSDMILLVGPDGRRLYASPASRKLLGYEPEEVIGLRLQEMIHPEDARLVLPVLAERPGETTLTYRMRRKDGGYIWVEATGRTVEVAGESQRLVIVRDVESRMAAENRIKASEARYRLLAENSSDMVFQLDHNLERRYVSPACREILGYEPEELIGIKPVSMTHPEDAPRVAAAFEALMLGRANRLSFFNRLRHKDGRWIWVEAHVRALKDPETNQPIGLTGALRDISRRKEMEDELAEANRRLKRLAEQDGLTGLGNRRAFDEALIAEFQHARQTDRNVAVIMVDVDRFKAFNDNYGHCDGDDCLKRIAEAIAGAVRRVGDSPARYGGEEFAVVLGATDETGALAVAARIRQAVLDCAIAHRGAERGIVTVSAGVASVAPASGDETPQDLINQADRALYAAKREGRNIIVCASSLAKD